MPPRTPYWKLGGHRWTCIVEVCREDSVSGAHRWSAEEVQVKTNFDNQLLERLERSLEAPYRDRLLEYDLRVAEVLRPASLKGHSTDFGEQRFTDT